MMSFLNRIFLVVLWGVTVLGGALYGHIIYDVGTPDPVSESYLYLPIDAKKHPPEKLAVWLDDCRHQVVTIVSGVEGKHWDLITNDGFAVIKKCYLAAMYITLERGDSRSPVYKFKQRNLQAYQGLAWRIGAVRRSVHRLTDIWIRYRRTRELKWRGKLDHIDRRSLYAQPGDKINLESTLMGMFKKTKILPDTPYQKACAARSWWVMKWLLIMSFMMFLFRLLLQISDRRLYLRLNWPELIFATVPGYSLYNICIAENDPRERYLQRVSERKHYNRMSNYELNALIEEIQAKRRERRREIGHIVMQFQVAISGLTFAAAPAAAKVPSAPGKAPKPAPIPAKPFGSKRKAPTKKSSQKKKGGNKRKVEHGDGRKRIAVDGIQSKPDINDQPAKVQLCPAAKDPRIQEHALASDQTTCDTSHKQSVHKHKPKKLKTQLSGFSMLTFNPERPDPDDPTKKVDSSTGVFVRSDFKGFPNAGDIGFQLTLAFSPGILIGGAGITANLHKGDGLFVATSLLLRGKLFLPTQQEAGLTGTWDIQPQLVVVKSFAKQQKFLFLLNIWLTGDAPSKDASGSITDGMFKAAYLHLSRFTLWKHFVIGIDSEGSFNTRGDPTNYWQAGLSLGYAYKWVTFVAVLNAYTDTRGWWGVRPVFYVQFRP